MVGSERLHERPAARSRTAFRIDKVRESLSPVDYYLLNPTRSAAYPRFRIASDQGFWSIYQLTVLAIPLSKFSSARQPSSRRDAVAPRLADLKKLPVYGQI